MTLVQYRSTRRNWLVTVCAVLGTGGLAGCSDSNNASYEREGEFRVEIDDGTAAPGETVTLLVTENGEPVENATVRVDYQEVGTTDDAGKLTVTLPQKSDVAIDARRNDREGELEITFGGNSTDDTDELEIEIVDGTAGPGETVTLSVTADGEPVAGAEVEVGGESVGTTDADGQLTVTLPDADEVEIEADSSDRSGDLTLVFTDDEQ